jgi:hypothetical protein
MLGLGQVHPNSLASRQPLGGEQQNRTGGCLRQLVIKPCSLSWTRIKVITDVLAGLTLPLAA